VEIPLNKDVICNDVICGRSTRLIINPVNDQVTHLVVAEKDFPNPERMVPVAEIAETSHEWIKLRVDQAEFLRMEPFIETDFIEAGKINFVLPLNEPYMYWPYSIYEDVPVPLEHKHLPVGEVAIHRGTPVIATDGKIGKVDEFLVYPTNDNISHLILREGHLWGQKDVMIPVDAIEKITEDGVFLKKSKQFVESLPAIPVKRSWN
jgi:uncharacterized protein YrrD